MKTGNEALHKANKAKEDEFYTQLRDIEAEIAHYKDCFKGKTVLCNCDDPYKSEFANFFINEFSELGLKKLICMGYVPTNPLDEYISNCKQPHPWRLDMTPVAKTWTHLKGDGDFRSKESIDALDESDIVVTNPPFSLFREFLSLIMKYDKEFLILGSQNVITYKDVFPLLKDEKMWLGCHNGDMSFKVPSDYEPRLTRYWQDEDGQKWRSLGNISWFTNMEHDRHHIMLNLSCKYDENRYPHYDNADAIEVSRVEWMPLDYYGIMGVPITYLPKHCPEQFEIIKFRKGDDDKDLCYTTNGKKVYPYFRILIRRR